mgnify:FL=1
MIAGMTEFIAMCAGCLRLWYGDHAGVFDKINCEKGDRYGDDG